MVCTRKTKTLVSTCVILSGMTNIICLLYVGWVTNYIATVYVKVQEPISEKKLEEDKGDTLRIIERLDHLENVIKQHIQGTSLPPFSQVSFCRSLSLFMAGRCMVFIFISWGGFFLGGGYSRCRGRGGGERQASHSKKNRGLCSDGVFSATRKFLSGCLLFGARGLRRRRRRLGWSTEEGATAAAASSFLALQRRFRHLCVGTAQRRLVGVTPPPSCVLEGGVSWDWQKPWARERAAGGSWRLLGGLAPHPLPFLEEPAPAER